MDTTIFTLREQDSFQKASLPSRDSPRAGQASMRHATPVAAKRRDRRLAVSSYRASASSLLPLLPPPILGLVRTRPRSVGLESDTRARAVEDFPPETDCLLRFLLLLHLLKGEAVAHRVLLLAAAE